jgi:hypothetical protein
MAMKRVSRGRPVAQETAAEFRQLRAQVAEELPDLIARHEQRTGLSDGEPPVPSQDTDSGANRPRPSE